MALKNTHYRKLDNGLIIPIARKKIEFSIDIDMLYLTVYKLLYVSQWSTVDEFDLTELNNLTAMKLEKKLLSYLKISGEDAFFDIVLPDDEDVKIQLINKVEKKVNSLFPHLVKK